MVMVTARGTAGVSVEIGPIDIDILNKQYTQLIKLIEHDEDNELWGLVYMIGDILSECDVMENLKELTELGQEIGG